MSALLPALVRQTGHVISQTGTNVTIKYFHPPSDGKYTLESIEFEPQTAAATDASNYFTLTAGKGVSAASGTHGTLTSNSSGGAANVLGTRRTMSLSGSADKSYDGTSATDCLELALTKAGTGATFHGDIIVSWKRGRDSHP